MRWCEKCNHYLFDKEDCHCEQWLYILEDDLDRGEKIEDVDNEFWGSVYAFYADSAAEKAIEHWDREHDYVGEIVTIYIKKPGEEPRKYYVSIDASIE